jgi:hypothetical protein
VLRVPESRPSVVFVGRTRVEPDPASIYALAEAPFDPLRETVLASGPALAPAGTFEGKLAVVETRPDRLHVTTESEAPGIVVSLDAWDPGWKATVDGAPVDVLRADVLFKAVAVPAGRHDVVLRYRPRAALAGAAGSLVGLGLAALVLGAGRLRRRG